MIEDKKAEAQQALDDLFSENLLPFKLSASRVACNGSEEYVVYFHDGRLPAVDVSWCQGERFKGVFRTAVLDRVTSHSGTFT
jgi:hypothetical protein